MTAVLIPKRVPTLENGDRLSRLEFERRYRAMPHVKKAELIEGEVVMGSPVSCTFHGNQHFDLIIWLGTYRVATPGVEGGDNITIRLDEDNEPQPDVVLYVDPMFGGRIDLEDGYASGPPDLVAEISASSTTIDMNKKLRVYRRNRVSEYIVWRTYDEALDWFTFRDGEFVPLPPDPADGLLKSTVFPGLWLDSAALLKRDMPVVLAALQRGLASAEHAAFVQKLASQRKQPEAP